MCYISNRLTDFDEICYDDALALFTARRAIGRDTTHRVGPSASAERCLQFVDFPCSLCRTPDGRGVARYWIG